MIIESNNSSALIHRSTFTRVECSIWKISSKQRAPLSVCLVTQGHDYRFFIHLISKWNGLRIRDFHRRCFIIIFNNHLYRQCSRHDSRWKISCEIILDKHRKQHTVYITRILYRLKKYYTGRKVFRKSNWHRDKFFSVTRK